MIRLDSNFSQNLKLWKKITVDAAKNKRQDLEHGYLFYTVSSALRYFVGKSWLRRSHHSEKVIETTKKLLKCHKYLKPYLLKPASGEHWKHAGQVRKSELDKDSAGYQKIVKN